MRVVVAIALLFVAQFGITALGAQHREADFAWQQWLGSWILDAHRLPRALGNETFTAPGAPWVAQEWLFSTALTLSMRAGAFPVFAFIVAIGAGAALVACAARARILGASWPSIWIVTIATALAMEQMFGVRAQVAAWPLFALLLLLLECKPSVQRYAIAVTALWANLHASVFLAPIYAALRAPRAILLVAGCAAATLVTPFGFGLPVYALHLVGSPIRHTILEWRSPHFTDLSFALGFLPIALAACGALLLDRRTIRRDLPVLAFFTFFALGAVRNVPLAAMALAPIGARALSHALTDRMRIVALLRERAVTAVGVVAIVATIAVLGLRTQAIAEQALPALPERQIARAALLPGMRHVYCEDFAWCSLALEYPRLRTFLDGRCDPFPLAVWDAYGTIRTSRERRMPLLDRFQVDTVVASRDGNLARALRADRSWRVVLEGRRFTLFARE